MHPLYPMYHLPGMLLPAHLPVHPSPSSLCSKVTFPGSPSLTTSWKAIAHTQPTSPSLYISLLKVFLYTLLHLLNHFLFPLVCKSHREGICHVLWYFPTASCSKNLLNEWINECYTVPKLFLLPLLSDTKLFLKPTSKSNRRIILEFSLSF